MNRTDEHSERPTDAGDSGDAPEFITSDESLDDAERMREQSKEDQEYPPDTDTPRE